MASLGKAKWGALAAGFALSLLAVAVVASFLPLIETNTWWIRYFDFPRLQFAIALVLLLAIVAALRAQIGGLGWVICALGVLALGYHAMKLHPFNSLTAHAAVGLESCAPDDTLTIMIANVQERNEEAVKFLNLVNEVAPDVLLVMETDAWWDRRLAPLRESFRETEQFIPEGHGAFGMHIFSRLPLISPEFRFWFDAYTPTAVTGVQLPSGEVVQFVGVHPHPPLAWSQPTTLRDGSLLAAALLARSSASATIFAGDFNAVPWEPVTRRAARIGGLLDPRIGRGFYATFSADSVLMSWPLDQILYQNDFGLLEFEVLPGFGSDHFPVMARLCHAAEHGLLQAAPEASSKELAEAERSIEAARAMDLER